MLDIYRYGQAAMEERRQNRRLGELDAYLRREYGSSSGMERYIAEANHTSSLPSSLRTFLAKIAGVVSRPSTRAAPAASVEPTLSEECADKSTPRPQATMGPRVRPVDYRRGFNVRPRTALPPLKR